MPIVLKFSLVVFCFFLIGFRAFAETTSPACAPFRSHPSLQRPPAFEFQTPTRLSRNWEQEIVFEISKSDPGFAEVYRPWRLRHPKFLSDLKRYEWLSCLYYYVKMRTGSAKESDWTAIVDEAPSSVIYPRDVDALLNVTESIPQAFKLRRKKTAVLQRAIFSKYKILVLDHTDEQSDFVLKNLLELLDHAFGKKLLSGIPSFHYFYAFTGHDVSSNVAAFHRQMKAISIGGISNYSKKKFNSQERMAVLSALAHEIGHAFLFDQVAPSELLRLAERFSDWKISDAQKQSQINFYSPIFFEANPRLQEIENLFLGSNAGRISDFKNLTSQYAAKNLHEWFADSFAASILKKLGQAHQLPRNWERNMIGDQDLRLRHYWVNYNNLSPDFFAWFAAKEDEVARSNVQFSFEPDLKMKGLQANLIH
jgi:hypothetical protein